MKATGMIRKVDDLGRVVIPKEIRKGLRIRVGDPMEIYIEKSGQIILKKYAPLGDFLKMAEQYVETLYKTTGHSACITDSEEIIAICGTNTKDYIDKEISSNILNIMEDRQLWSTKDDRIIILMKEETNPKYTAQIVSPIISDNDAIGTVILFTCENKTFSDVEMKLVQSASTFLGKQME